MRSTVIGIRHIFLLQQPGEPLVTFLNREGVTQGDLSSVVFYGITLLPLSEYLREADLGLLSLFYVDDAVFNGSERRGA